MRAPRLITSAVGMLVLATACSGADTRPEATAPPAQPVVKGGTLVVGASQEPPCADWYATCGQSSWGIDMMATQTLPRTFDFVDGRYRPSVLLAGEPDVDVGPPQRVTYRIDPRAVWSDGQPITSADFRYTFEQSKTGALPVLTAVDRVDDSDPRTAVVTYAGPDPAWRDGFLRGLLPRHLLEGKDRTSEMRNGYSWSGGPWVIDHWTKGQEIKLVQNPAFWGTRPNLDAVVFKVIPDAAAYQAAYRSGQLDVAFVQGAQPGVEELKALPDTSFEATVGTTFEYVLFNTQKPPFDSQRVRQALVYATDRAAIVRQLSGALMPDIGPAETFMSPANRQWYSEPFKAYGRDLTKVTQLMTADGWVKAGDGIWAKGGGRAQVELTVAAGNRRRELAQQILQSQWKEAGFEVAARNVAGPAVIDSTAKGTFHAALFGTSPSSTDPNILCRLFCSRYIPTEANGFQGGSYSRLASPAFDSTAQMFTTELDEGKRLDLVRRAQQVLADEVPGVPMSAVIDITVYNSAKVGGPVQTDLVGRAFSRMAEWYCKGCG